MTTDNRTSEQVIAEADALYDSIGVTVFRVEFRELYAELRTPGCLTGEPNQNEPKSGQDFGFTEAQVEAAAKAIADCHNPGMFEKYPENWRVEARAALVAAQGDAPQAERDWRLDVVPEPWIDLAPVLPSSTESPVEPFKTWFACWWKNEPNAIAESNAQSAFYAGWDARGLPSSGVDVDALAEAWEAGCLAGKSREHHANMTEEQAEKAWPNPYRGGQVDSRG